MPEDHRHCIICGKVVGAEKFFCSPRCEETFAQHQKRMRRMRLMMIVMLVGLFIVLLLLAQFGKSS